MFLEAIEAYSNWNDGEPEPTVTYEVHYQPEEIPISRACGGALELYRYTPIGRRLCSLELCGMDLKSRTYAAAALRCWRQSKARIGKVRWLDITQPKS
jgi:hypothetical protein